MSCGFFMILTGCVTDDLANKQDVYMVRSQVNEQIIHMEDRLNALEGQVDAMDKKQEDIQNRIAGMENSLNNKMFAYQKDISTLQQDLKSMKESVSSQIDKKMDVVIEEVIKENQKIAEKINALQKEKYDLGIYHTVQRGETLSEIASKYGVSVDDVIASNEIENPDRLKIGQKLFIPQK